MPTALLKFTTPDANGQPQTTRLSLDSEADTYDADLDRALELARAEEAAPLRAQIATLSAERDAHRDLVIDEIVRVRTLSYDDEGDFDAEGERAFLESLDAARLKTHFTRALTTELSTTPKTDGKATPPAGDEPYANLKA